MSVWDYIKRNADRPDDWSSEELSGADFRELLATRNAIIEECAQLIFEAADRTVSYASVQQITAAIRALKDK